MLAAVVVLYGIACSDGCGASSAELAAIEHEVRTLLASKGFSVQPPSPDLDRPTGPKAPLAPTDHAEAHRADRVVALDLEPGGRVLWVSQFVRGVFGAWAIDKVACRRPEGGALSCPGLSGGLIAGLRPRTSEDVDFVAALRAQAYRVEGCVRANDKVPPSERIFGKVDLELEARPSGKVRVKAIAPALVSRSPFGACLRTAMERMDLGAFFGAPVRLRIPVDL